MFRLLKIASAAAVLAVLGDADANAAGEKFCNTYAGTSVDQFNRSQELGLSVSGPRWHGVFDLHKVWCRVVSKAAAQHEIEARRDVIGRADPYGSEPPPSEDGAEPPPSEHGAAPPPPEYDGGPPPSWSDDEPPPSSYGEAPPSWSDDEPPPSEYGEAPPSWSDDEPPPPGGEEPPSWYDDEPPPSEYGSEPPPSWADEDS